MSVVEKQQSEAAKTDPRFAMVAASVTILIVAFLIVIKTLALFQSNSASVMASLIDSLSDLCISIFSFAAVRYSLKPADEQHRYGHGKIEGLFALFEASFIFGAAVFVLFESLSRFASGNFAVEQHGLAIGIMLISILCSAVLITIQHLSLKRAPSLAIESDKANYSTDIIVNIGVIAVLTAIYFGAPSWLDVVMAVAIAFYMAVVAKKVAGDGLNMLLDREVSGELRERLTKIILTNTQVIGFHDLRTRRSGMNILISFDIEVDAELSLFEAHEICRAVEMDIFNEYPNAQIFIHVDPHNDTDDTRHVVSGVHDA